MMPTGRPAVMIHSVIENHFGLPIPKGITSSVKFTSGGL